MSVLYKLGWFFRRFWRRYALAFVTLVVIAGLIMVPPWITGGVVDAIAAHQLTLNALLLYVGAVIFVALVVYVLRIIWRLQLYGASFQLAALLRSRIYDHLTFMAPAFFAQHRAGNLMAHATNDVAAVEMTAGEAVLALVDGAITGIVVLTVMMVTLSWKLTLLALLPWPVMAYFIWRFGNELHDAFTDSQRHFSLLNDKTQESLAGVRLIKAFGQQQRTLAAYTDVVTDTSRANLKVAQVDAKFEPTIFLTIGISFLLAVAGGGWWIKQGELTVGELTTFTMYLGYLIWPMFAFGWTLNLLERGSAAYERIEQLLAAPPGVADMGSEVVVEKSDIGFAITRFSYSGGDDVLGRIHVALPAGQTLGIVGPTGAGKTTLLGLLLRLYEGQEAGVTLGGRPLSAYRLDALRRQFGFVPQDPFLFSATVAQNIALGAPEATPETIREAARLACVHKDILAFPDQYNTLVGERGVTLSGGQKQRVAIARALLLDAPILVLDDALSAVDMQTEGRILHHLRTQRRGRTNLIVSHRLSAVMDADEIIVLRHGNVAERGTHQVLMRMDGWYAQMFRYQQVEQTMNT